MKPILIVGGGPVGLFLACLLAQQGRAVLVLERREAASDRARSIGLHPPALEALASLGLADPLLECGVAIRRALVYDEGEPLGALSLDGCPPPFPFVLSLPQRVTEGLLEERLERLASGSLVRGAEVAAVRVEDDVRAILADGTAVTGDVIVGCDGHASTVRDTFTAPLRQRPGTHHYLMADLPDSSDLGSDAALYLGRAGVVESFPLPGRGRRWVVRVAGRTADGFEELRRTVAERSGHTLPPEGDASSFTARNRLWGPLAGPRWALVGDAAHVVSPIGGQGMNLGLLGAVEAVRCGLGREWRPLSYDHRQRRRARRSARRAGLNMYLGGDRVPAAARRLALRTLLHPWAAPRAARFFTMRGL